MTAKIDFDRISSEEMPQALRIAEYFHQAGHLSIMDVGCGPGIYTTAINSKPMLCHGVDIDDRIPGGLCFTKMDITEVGAVPPQGAQVVLSLEVGEHIPEEKAHHYLMFMQKTGAKLIYFSAAAPGQGGEGHINCQPKNYWIEQFCRLGFYYDEEERRRWLNFMADGYHMGWLLNNGMVFREAR